MPDAVWISQGLPLKWEVDANNYPFQKHIAELAEDVLDAQGGVVFAAGTVFVSVVDALPPATYMMRRLYFLRPDYPSFQLLTSWVIPGEYAENKTHTCPFIIRKDATGTYIHAATTMQKYVLAVRYEEVWYGKYNLALGTSGSWDAGKISQDPNILNYTYRTPDIDGNIDGSKIIVVWTGENSQYHYTVWHRPIGDSPYYYAMAHDWNVGWGLQRVSVKWISPTGDQVYVSNETVSSMGSLYSSIWNNMFTEGDHLADIELIDAQMVLAPNGELGFLTWTESYGYQFRLYDPLTGLNNVETIFSLPYGLEAFCYGLTVRKSENGVYYYHALFYVPSAGVMRLIHYKRELGSGQIWVEDPVLPPQETGYPFNGIAGEARHAGCQDEKARFPKHIGKFGFLTVDRDTGQVWYRRSAYWSATGLEIVDAIAIEVDVDKLTVQRRGDYGIENALKFVETLTLSDGRTIFADSERFNVFDDSICTIFGYPQNMTWEFADYPNNSNWQISAEVRVQFKFLAADPSDQNFSISFTTADGANGKTIMFTNGDSGVIKPLFLQGRAPFGAKLLSDGVGGTGNVIISDVFIEIIDEEQI